MKIKLYKIGISDGFHKIQHYKIVAQTIQEAMNEAVSLYKNFKPRNESVEITQENIVSIDIDSGIQNAIK